MNEALLILVKYLTRAKKPLINQVRPAASQMPQTPKTGNRPRRMGKPILPMTSTTPLLKEKPASPIPLSTPHDLRVFDEELHYCFAANLGKGKDYEGEYGHDDHALCKAFLDALVIACT